MAIKSITIYHALYDTGELADKKLIGVETEYSLVSGELNRSKYEISVRASLPGNLYPLYAIHCGEVKYFNANTHRTGLTISGTIYNNEIDNTWIVVYAEVSPYETREAKIFTENEDARLFVSNSLIDFEDNGSYLEQSDNFDFYDISISTGAMSEEFFTYGSTYSPTCSIEMMPTDKVTQGNWIRIEFKVYGVWQNFGVFYIKEPPQNTSEYILVEGIGMLEYIGSKFIPLIHIISIKKAVEYLWETYGVPLTFDFDVYDSSIANYYNNSSVVLPSEAIETTYTDSKTGAEWSGWELKTGTDDLRSVLSKMSLGLYSNVVERNGLLIVTHNDWLDYKETELFTDDNCVSEPIQKLDAYYSPDRVKIICEKMAWNKTWNVASYVDGAEVEVQFLNDKVQDETKNIIYYPLEISTENGGYCEVQPLASQQWGNQPFSIYDLNTLAGELGLEIPFYYYPIETEINGYSPFIYAGSCIKLRINGVVRDIYVGNLNLSWSGGMFSMSISTPGDIDIQGVEASSSSTSSGGVSSSASGSVSVGLATSIQNATIFDDGAITGDKIAVNTIKASNIDVDDLFSENITATNLTITGNSDIVGGKIGGFDVGADNLNAIKYYPSEVEGEDNESSIKMSNTKSNCKFVLGQYEYTNKDDVSYYQEQRDVQMDIDTIAVVSATNILTYSGSVALWKQKHTYIKDDGVEIAYLNGEYPPKLKVVKYDVDGIKSVEGIESFDIDAKISEKGVLLEDKYASSIQMSYSESTSKLRVSLISPSGEELSAKSVTIVSGGGGGTEEEITAEMVLDWYGDIPALTGADGVGFVELSNYSNPIEAYGDIAITEVE